MKDKIDITTRKCPICGKLLAAFARKNDWEAAYQCVNDAIYCQERHREIHALCEPTSLQNALDLGMKNAEIYLKEKKVSTQLKRFSDSGI